MIDDPKLIGVSKKLEGKSTADYDDDNDNDDDDDDRADDKALNENSASNNSQLPSYSSHQQKYGEHDNSHAKDEPRIFKLGLVIGRWAWHRLKIVN